VWFRFYFDFILKHLVEWAVPAFSRTNYSQLCAWFQDNQESHLRTSEAGVPDGYIVGLFLAFKGPRDAVRSQVRRYYAFQADHQSLAGLGRNVSIACFASEKQRRPGDDEAMRVHAA